MSVVSGQVTFGSTGSTNVGLGITTNSIETYMGSRSGGTIETDGLISVGHADSGNQFCRNSKDARADKDSSHCVTAYSAAGTKVLEAAVTGGWGTATLTFNVTIANSNYPFDIVART